MAAKANAKEQIVAGMKRKKKDKEVKIEGKKKDEEIKIKTEIEA